MHSVFVLCSLRGTVDLEAIFIAEQVLADVLDGVLRLVLRELFKGLKKAWHDVLIEVLANGQVGVHRFLLVASLAGIFALIVAGFTSGVICTIQELSSG